MQVFVDSNQFIADFQLESAPMRYLFHFLNNSRHELLLSRLVIQEVENKYRERVTLLIADAEKIRTQLSRLGFARDARSEDGVQAVPEFDLQGILNDRVDNIRVVEYAHIPHDRLVERALARRKPFDADGRNGYRDSLLWLSLLDAVGSELSVENDIAFISDNWKDFYDKAPGRDSKARDTDDATQPSRAPVSFHEHLTEDIRSVSRVIEPFPSISAFVDTKVDKTAHEVDLHKQIDQIEPFLEGEGLDYLRNLGSGELKAVARSLLGEKADELTIIGTDAETLDGLEYLDIEFVKSIDGELFVGCNYDIRGVSLDLHVPGAQFDLAERVGNSRRVVWDVVRLDEIVVLRLLVEASFSVRFRLDPVTIEFSGYSVESLDLRRT